jgi:hypothetical protein
MLHGAQGMPKKSRQASIPQHDTLMHRFTSALPAKSVSTLFNPLATRCAYTGR